MSTTSMVVVHNVLVAVVVVAYCRRMVLDWDRMVDQVVHVVQVPDNGKVVDNVVQEGVVAHHSTDHRGLDGHQTAVHIHHYRTAQVAVVQRSVQVVVVVGVVMCWLL